MNMILVEGSISKWQMLLQLVVGEIRVFALNMIVIVMTNFVNLYIVCMRETMVVCIVNSYIAAEHGRCIWIMVVGGCGVS